MKNGRCGSALIEFAGSLLLLGTVFAGVFQNWLHVFSLTTPWSTRFAPARANASLKRARASSGNADLAKAVQNLVVYGDLVPVLARSQLFLPGDQQRRPHFRPGKPLLSRCADFQTRFRFSQVNLDGRPVVTFFRSPPERRNEAANAPEDRPLVETALILLRLLDSIARNRRGGREAVRPAKPWPTARTTPHVGRVEPLRCGRNSKPGAVWDHRTRRPS